MNRLSPPVLVGNEEQLRLLDESYEGVSKSEGTTIFVAGEAGVGKTRLCESFLDSAARRGAIIARGYCLADVSIPYFPFSEALAKLLAEHRAGISSF